MTHNKYKDVSPIQKDNLCDAFTVVNLPILMPI